MKDKRYLYLDSKQHGALLHSLVDFKNKLIRNGRSADIVDEVILKVMKAPVKKLKV